MFIASEKFLQFRIEGVIKIFVFLAEAKAAMALHRLACDFTKWCRGLHALALFRHVGNRQGCKSSAISASSLDSREQARLVRQYHKLAFGHARILGVTSF